MSTTTTRNVTPATTSKLRTSGKELAGSLFAKSALGSTAKVGE
jgi:hypothetical protein